MSLNINNIKNNARVKGTGGGGNRKSYQIGLWHDENGKQRHIKTTALGIDVEQGFLLAVENDKIIFYTLTKEQEKQVEKQGVDVFKTAKRNKIKKTYQNYASIEGIDEALYKQLCKINGGSNVRHDIHEQKWRDKFVVKALK